MLEGDFPNLLPQYVEIENFLNEKGEIFIS